MQKVTRLELLQRLEAVRPGLSERDIIDQSSCFVFKGGFVYTFNEDVYCRIRSGLAKEVTAAVTAAPLVDTLSHYPSPEVTVDFAGDRLTITNGKGDTTKLLMDQKITLPVDGVEKPQKEGWRPLAGEFSEAVRIVMACASTDDTQSILNCVHIHPKWVEASDDVQMCRYRLDTGFDKPIMVRRGSIKHVTQMEMSDYQEGEKWVHFRNAAGLTLSCLRFSEKYPYAEVSRLFKDFSGKRCKFPSGLKQSTQLAKMFSSEDQEDSSVLIGLGKGKMSVKGKGNSGEHTSIKKCKYLGPQIEFRIPPQMLIDIVGQHKECEVNGTHLVARSGRWKYLTALVAPKGHGDEYNDTPAPAGDESGEW